MIQKTMSMILQSVRGCTPVELSNYELITIAQHFKQRVSIF